MTSSGDGAGVDYAWFLGAAFAGGDDDQSARFVREGVWEQGYSGRYLEDVKSIRPGDRVAIKATYTRKHGLPFDNRGNFVSVMVIKATGIVADNPGDGRRLLVEWTPVDPPREWYFFTNMRTIWKVVSGNRWGDELLRFTFEDEPQDIDSFRNRPFWADRFGDRPQTPDRFGWTVFYTAFADRLLDYRNDREPLISAIYEVSDNLSRPLPLEDQFADGSSGRLRDICPFTTLAQFNRRMTDENRRTIAHGLADLLGVAEPVPESFDGVPLFDNRNTWFFHYDKYRHEGQIDALWQVFGDALEYADGGGPASGVELEASFDKAIPLPYVKRRLTTGLFWARPWNFATLDAHSSAFIARTLEIRHDADIPDARSYLALCNTLEELFADEGSTVHSFPELSVMAYDSERDGGDDPELREDDEGPTEPESERRAEPEDGTPYSVGDIIGDGCFLEVARLEAMLERLRDKKNLILQGPPGTGKTWLAKRLAYALIGRRSEHRVRPFQFHPNLSYEDFVRGWRPEEGGGLQLVDGPFLEAVEAAAGDPDDAYVLVIEEINRGNPAQIFGEMLTLLEADKRNPAEAIALSYRRHPAERVHIPPNLYVIGTMNVADRSLALVDFALRRRFAFVDLEPTFGDAWRSWVSEQSGVGEAFLRDVESRLNSLNRTIAEDTVLGPHFQVGHSVVTPPGDVEIPDPQQWFRRVVETEIAPLLAEYWFDAPDQARSEKEKLLRGLHP